MWFFVYSQACEVNLYVLYCDHEKQYPPSNFGVFIDFGEHIHDWLCLC
jgi:hypothetical protein